MERGTFFHLLGATGEGEGGGGPSKGLLFLPAEASKGSREKGGRDKPEKLFRAWRGRERERERESPMGRRGFDRALHSPLWSLGLFARPPPISRAKRRRGACFLGIGGGRTVYIANPFVFYSTYTLLSLAVTTSSCN